MRFTVAFRYRTGLSTREDCLAFGKICVTSSRKLEKEGELRRIGVEVDPILEITEITDRVTRAGGPALLFERPKGSRTPLLINMLGSERRMNLALEVSHVDEVGARIRGFLDMQSPQGLLDKLKMLPKLAELGSFFPKSVKTGPCKEVIRRFTDFLFTDFPICRCCRLPTGITALFDAPEVLAAGCRTFHYLAIGHHAQPGNREAQRRRVSHASLRRAHHGDALANAGSTAPRTVS